MKFQSMDLGDLPLGRSLLRVIAISFIGVMASGCAQLNGNPDGAFTAQKMNAVEYKVRPGDSLSKIAGRLTTTEDNWQVLAQFNNINDPRSLQVGMALMIPEHLIPDSGVNTTVPATNVATAATPKTRPKTRSRDTTDWVFQATALPGVLEASVILQAVRVNRSFEIFRVGDGSQQAATLETTQLVKVVGSYYPKPIYTEPTNSSRLLLRVAPGATFELDRVVGDWIRVFTDEGIGYIRGYDAEVLGISKVRRVVVDTHS